MHRLQVIVDEARTGALNMAIDDVLLEHAAAQQVCIWRFYRWSEPTLSLGYFQRANDRALHPTSRECAMVRRSSGGGAILHDREWTYSLTIPAEHPWAKATPKLYEQVHAALVKALAEQGVTARICGEAEAQPDVEPFLCFERRAIGDVLVQDAKILGSAQRRRSGGIVQHGSLLIERSPFALDLPGVNDLAGRKLDENALRATWLREFGNSLEATVEESSMGRRISQFPSTVLERAQTIAAEKYATTAWTERR